MTAKSESDDKPSHWAKVHTREELVAIAKKAGHSPANSSNYHMGHQDSRWRLWIQCEVRPGKTYGHESNHVQATGLVVLPEVLIEEAQSLVVIVGSPEHKSKEYRDRKTSAVAEAQVA